MSALQAKLPDYRRQNVQVLGISVDEPVATAKWANEVGISFPLLADTGGRIAKRFGLFDTKSQRSAKALAVVFDGEVVYSKRVNTTEVPKDLTPWMEKVLSR